MNILIAILIALNSYVMSNGTTYSSELNSADAYTQEYMDSHDDAMQKATIIYNNGWYTEREGGVIINDGVSI